jgi:hypothetical protein
MLNRLMIAGIVCLMGLGCDSSTPVKRAPIKPAQDDAPNEPPEQSEPPLDDDEPKMADTENPGEHAGPRELKLPESPLTFQVPADWKSVTPENKIIEAEFELPRADGDEFDGRLTLMSSGGDRDEVIATRTAEFRAEPGESPSRESISVGGVDSTIVDLRGTWSGPSFRPINPPREGYRMLFIVVPLGERSSFYAKLTGPRGTIAAHEEAFREFLKSAKISR